MIKDYVDRIRQEEQRNENFLHLTANEAQMSKTARLFLGSKLSERYYWGAGEKGAVYMDPFTALGFPNASRLIERAEDAARKMLGARVVNFSMLSGVHAMMCAILSTTRPGDTVMTVHHDHGGHFATAGILKAVGRKHVYAAYDVPHLRFDTATIGSMFRDMDIKALYLDVSYYLNPHNVREIRKAIGEKQIIIYDASHTMGLIMGQTFQSPLREGANVICANTHKTLPGPQKGMIAFRDREFGENANSIITDSLYSSPHLHHLIALSTTILEMQTFGKEYARQVIANSNALGKAFVDLGYSVRKANTGRYSENHQVHVFIENLGDDIALYQKLVDNNISTNFDRLLGPDLFMRLGTQEVTRRGMKEGEMRQIAIFLDRALNGENIKDEIIAFNRQFSDILYSFDKEMHNA